MRTVKIYGMITIGSFIYALGFNWFFTPNQIAYAGVTGIAQMINALVGVPSIGTLIVLINIPLFILGWRLLGWKTLVSSLYAMFMGSIFIDIVDAAYQFKPLDPMLASIFGGVLLGVSLGMIIVQGATTGGTDLAAKLLQLKLGWLPMGKLLLALDFVVILGNAVVFRRLESALYGIVALYISTKMLDAVLYGMDTARVAYIISPRGEEITAAIFAELDRGVTVIPSRGAYSGEEKEMLMCVIKDRQIVKLKKLLKEIDPHAFIVVSSAHEVLGEGFLEH